MPSNFRHTNDEINAMRRERTSMLADIASGTLPAEEVFLDDGMAAGGLQVRKVLKAAFGWSETQIGFIMLSMGACDWYKAKIRDLKPGLRKSLATLCAQEREREQALSAQALMEAC